MLDRLRPRSLRLSAHLAAQITDVPVYEIRGKKIERRVTRARQVFYMLARYCGHSYPKVGRFVGRHHTTVIDGVKACKERLKTDVKLQEAVANACCYIDSRPPSPLLPSQDVKDSLGLEPRDRRVLEMIKASPNGATRADVIDTLYGHREDGGPLTAHIEAVSSICRIRKALRSTPWVIPKKKKSTTYRVVPK